jgi:hypothetical protein
MHATSYIISWITNQSMIRKPKGNLEIVVLAKIGCLGNNHFCCNKMNDWFFVLCMDSNESHDVHTCGRLTPWSMPRSEMIPPLWGWWLCTCRIAMARVIGVRALGINDQDTLLMVDIIIGAQYVLFNTRRRSHIYVMSTFFIMYPSDTNNQVCIVTGLHICVIWIMQTGVTLRLWYIQVVVKYYHCIHCIIISWLYVSFPSSLLCSQING